MSGERYTDTFHAVEQYSPCLVPTYGMCGPGSALRNAGPHDWRLIEERPQTTRQVAADALEIVPPARRWYCCRCRTVEETSA